MFFIVFPFAIEDVSIAVGYFSVSFHLIIDEISFILMVESCDM